VPDLRKTLGVLFLFSVAMGYLESAVVVYLRELYYPGGFRFPLVPLPPRIAITEIGREAATLIMLVSAGWLAGRNRLQRAAFFLFSFAVWDLFYYVFLKVLLDWPESLFTMDILFLIPVPWTGPVLAPCFVSLTMIAAASVMLKADRQGVSPVFPRRDKLLMGSGTLLIFFSFIRDYLFSTAAANGVGDATAPYATLTLEHYLPGSFHWIFFLAGEALLLLAIGHAAKRASR
jgi:hypothetical protein